MRPQLRPQAEAPSCRFAAALGGPSRAEARSPRPAVLESLGAQAASMADVESKSDEVILQVRRVERQEEFLLAHCWPGRQHAVATWRSAVA